MSDEDKKVINSEIIKSISEELGVHAFSSNYFFFSVIKGVWKGQYVKIGTAAFKNVFWSKNANDTLRKYFLNESTPQLENILKKIDSKRNNEKNDQKPYPDEKAHNEDRDILGTKLLFKGIKTTLSLSEKLQIYKLLDFRMSKTKSKFILDNQEDDPDPYWGAFEATLYITDLNKDGIEEVFVIYGNLYTSGMTGESVVLFIKNSSEYSKNLNFPGTIHGVMKTDYQGYNDLLIEWCKGAPIWRWDGNKYQFLRLVSNEEFETLEYSKLSDITIK